MRLKIGFTAFIKRMTVSQLFYTTILKAHDDLVREGSIPLYDPMLDQKINTFDELLNNQNAKGFESVAKSRTQSLVGSISVMEHT